jgi:lipocalin-like protein
MGSSTHFGTLSIEHDHAVLVFHIQGASFPNWEGQDQRRQYELNDGILSYRVAPRPNGDVPISVWRRVE